MTVGRFEDFRSSDPQHPLGPGMPPGRALRLDGEGHRDWWMSVIRADPCSYCGERGGTVDHIVPQRLRIANLHDWLNYTGACERCNGSKRDRHLLWFLRTRTRAGRQATAKAERAYRIARSRARG